MIDQKIDLMCDCGITQIQYISPVDIPFSLETTTIINGKLINGPMTCRKCHKEYEIINEQN